MLLVMQSTRYSCQILRQLEFSGQVLEKYSNIKFHENRSCRSSVAPCKRTDRQTHDEANSRFSQFCESFYKLVAYKAICLQPDVTVVCINFTVQLSFATILL